MINKGKSAKLIPVTILAAASWSVHAEDIPVFTLGEIKVSAGADARPTFGESSIDSESMRQFDKLTVASALNMVPGISMTKMGARNEQMVSVRGFDMRQVPLFVDGIPVYVPYDGYVDLGRFNTFDLARIDVAKGFASLIYGPNTLGGAINLVSRRPQGHFEGEVGAGLSFSDIGEDNGYHGYTNVGTNQGKWYFQGSASWLDQRNFSLPDDFVPAAGENGGTRDNSYARDRKVNLKLGLTPNAEDEYAINYINQHGVKGVPPYAGNVAGVAPRYWRWPYWDKESLYFIGNTAFGAGHHVKVRAYYDAFRNSMFTYDDASYTTQLRPSSFQSWYNDYSSGASVEGDFRLAQANLLKAAYHYKNDVHREHNGGQPERTFQDHTQSLALEDDHEFGTRLSLVTGVSYEQHDTVRAEDYVGNRIVPFATGDASNWNGQAGIAYKLTNSGRMSVSVSAKSRFPTIKDRYSYRLGSAIPNAELRAERARNYEIGYSDRIGDRVDYSLALFQSDIADMIQAIAIAPSACSAPPCTQMQNVGEVRANGMEAGLSTLLGGWELGGNYTYLDRHNLSNPNVLLTDTPRHKLFLHATGSLPAALVLTVSVDAMSARYSSSSGSQVAGGFGVANLKLGRKFGKVTLEGGVRNLFDRLYAYSEGYPEPGRTWFVQFNSPL